MLTEARWVKAQGHRLRERLSHAVTCLTLGGRAGGILNAQSVCHRAQVIRWGNLRGAAPLKRVIVQSRTRCLNKFRAPYQFEYALDIERPMDDSLIRPGVTGNMNYEERKNLLFKLQLHSAHDPRPLRPPMLRVRAAAGPYARAAETPAHERDAQPGEGICGCSAGEP